jgi:FkbM family methyltransferase
LELWFNAGADFTKWIVAKGLLQEPFVVVDIGVQGDASVRWNLLDDYLIFHGFDAIAEVIDKLSRLNNHRPNRNFHNIAIGEADREQVFYVNPTNPTASSMYEQGASRFEGTLGGEARVVTVHRLDTLFASGVIPTADFLKVDVEGHEKEVFLGAREFIGASVLAVETETSFGISPNYPKSHFVAMMELLVQQHLLVFDLNFNRVSRASYQRMLKCLDREVTSELGVGKPATVNVLFCRDLIDEADRPNHYLTPCSPVSVDQMIKMMVIYELHGLNDIALDTAARFAERLGTRLDVDQAIRLLANPDCGPSTPLIERIRYSEKLQQQLSDAYEERIRDLEKLQQRLMDDYEQSTSWRLTAPLRAVKWFLVGRK